MKTKNGISLIVLILTILIMLILVSAVTMSLNNVNVIDKAEEAVGLENIQTEKTRLELIKGQVLLRTNGKITIEKYVEELIKQGVTTEDKITHNEDGTKVVETEVGHKVLIEEEGTNVVNITILGTDGQIPIQAAITTNITWENGMANILIAKTSIVDDSYNIEYSIDEGKTYTNTDGNITNIANGTIVLVRLTNGEKTTETEKIEIKDKVAPKAQASISTRTETTIGINVTAVENETGIKEYRYYIKKTTDKAYTLIETTQQSTYTYEGLEADGSYDIKVEVEDNSQNTGTATLNGMSTTGEAAKISAVSITGATTNSLNVKVTLSKGKNVTYSYYYKLETAEDYTAFKENISENTQTITGLQAGKTYEIKVVATNVEGQDYKTITGNTIDIITAVGNVTLTNTTWNDGKATITVTKSSSVDASLNMEYSIDGGTSYNKTTGTIANITNNTTVLVRFTDGKNEGEATEIAVKDTNKPEVSIVAGTITETTIAVNVTAVENETGIKEYRYYIKNTTDTAYTLAATTQTASYTYTKIGETLLQAQTSYDIKVEVEDNGLNTGSNTTTIETTVALPVISDVNVIETTTNSIKVVTTLAKGKNVTYSYYYKVQGASNYTLHNETATTDAMYTITGLQAGKTYDIKVVVINSVGQDSKETSGSTIEVSSAEGNITLTNTTWNDGKATITVTKSSSVDASLNMEYSLDGGTNYNKTTGTITNITNNTTVLVRFTDGKNVGEATEIAVKDTNKPEVSIVAGTITETTIAVNVTAVENETGIKEYRYYIKNATDTAYTLAATTQTASYTYTKIGETLLQAQTSYDIKVEVEDNGLNIGESTATIVTAKATPVISNIEITEQKTNSLKVTVSLSKGENVTYSYYYKVEGDTDYTAFKENVSESTQTITGLQANKTYDIKVVVINSVGQDSKETSGSTIEVSSAEGNITLTNTTWSDGKATITVEKSSSVDASLNMEYSLDGGTNYTETTGTITNITNNTTILIRFTDGKNVGEATEITVKDTIKPQASIAVGTITETTIGVNVTAVENETGIKEYRYYIKKSTDTSYTLELTSTTATYTYQNLDADTSYDIKVEVEDKAENTGTKAITQSTAKQKPVISNVGIVETSTNSIKLQVTLSKGKDVTYSYYYRVQDSGDNYTLYNQTATTETTYTMTGLTQATTYELTVVATNTAGTSTYYATARTGEMPVQTSTLGELVASAENYGDTVNYTANGVSDWKVFYKQTVGTEEYVYLITSDVVPVEKVTSDLPVVEEKFNNIFRFSSNLATVAATIQNRDLWKAEWENYSDYSNGRFVSYFLDETYWTDFKNTEKYGDNIVGAIGTPTLEMMVSSMNDKSNISNSGNLLTLNIGEWGYIISGDEYVDSLYRVETDVLLASPAHYEGIGASQGPLSVGIAFSWGLGDDVISGFDLGLRPCVCLKADTPAEEGSLMDIALLEGVSSAELITLKNIEWTEGFATITVEKASTVSSNLTMEYSIDDGKTYAPTTGTITGLTSGTTVLVRLTDGTNYTDTLSIEVVKEVESESEYTLSGTWEFHDTLNGELYFSMNINFISNGREFSEIWTYDDGDLYGFTMQYDSNCVYTDSFWNNDAYRTVDFGDTPQEVSQEFYEWFTSNAVETEEEIPDNALKGTWQFNEQLNWEFEFLEDVEFIADDTQYYYLELVETRNGIEIYFEMDEVYNSIDGWQVDRTVDFGDTPQEVSQEFYEWFTSNATQ